MPIAVQYNTVRGGDAPAHVGPTHVQGLFFVFAIAIVRPLTILCLYCLTGN